MKNKLVGFIGAPGTGKTTLACAMKEYALTQRISADICTEYAREFSYKYGISNNPYAQYRITYEQKSREDCLMTGNSQYVFSDSPVWLGYVFGLVNLSSLNNAETRDVVADIYQKFVIDQIDRYHKVFHIVNENPYDDGCRDMKVNKVIANIIQGFVSSHRHFLPIIEITIPIVETEKRKEFVWSCLNQ